MTESASPLPNTELKELMIWLEDVAIEESRTHEGMKRLYLEDVVRRQQEAHSAFEALFGRLLSDNERLREANTRWKIDAKGWETEAIRAVARAYALTTEVSELWNTIRQKERESYAASNSLDVAELDARCSEAYLEISRLREYILTPEEAQKFMWLIENSSGYDDPDLEPLRAKLRALAIREGIKQR